MRKIIVLLLSVLVACGSEGASGDPGTMGSAGTPGPQGPVGPAGPAGPQGPVGATGAQGPAGAAGAQGPQGPAGTQGPAGVAGAQGPAGAPGAQGPAGVQGPAGAAGAKGATGARGPSAIVFSANNAQLGILLSATPGSEAYVSSGDAVTLVNDGLIVPMARTKVWYTNNDCTGTPYVAETFGYEPIANYVYTGLGNELFTASTTASGSLAVQSFSTGGGSCTVQSIAPKVHALTVVGTPTDLAATMPWHVVVQ